MSTPLLQIRNKHRCSALWRYSDTLTATTFGFPDSPEEYRNPAGFDDLVMMVHRHLTNNQKEVPVNLAWVIEDQIARGLPVRETKERKERVLDGTEIRSDRGASGLFSRIHSATKTIAHQVFTDDKWAEPAEVGKRIQICARCPKKKESGIGGCPSCHAAIRALALGRQHDLVSQVESQTCGICDCFLEAKVHFGIESILAGTRPELHALYRQVPTCWITKAMPKEGTPSAEG